MGALRKQYRDLEMTVLHQLREKIGKSKIVSKHVDEKCIRINVEDYEELAIINDELTFIDYRGLYYSVFTVGLEELIDILEPK